MSSDTLDAPTPEVRTRPRVRWWDLARVAARQHRFMLLGTGVLTAVGVVLLLLVGISAAVSSLTPPLSPSESSLVSWWQTGTELLSWCVTLYAAVVAAFWAAPMVSREYEQGTHLLAWSQDVTPSRWLAGKAATLLAAALLGAAVLGFLDRLAIAQVSDAVPGGHGPGSFRAPFFAAAPLPLLGYVAFAFALGLALSVLTRRTLVAMGASLATFLVTRFVVASFLRPHYEAPLRSAIGIGGNGPVPLPDGALQVVGGYLGASGTPASFPDACNAPTTAGARSYEDCLRGHGIVARYVDYQPPGRIGQFQAIELGIVAVLAVLLLVVTWRLIRRTRRL
jgi:ABC-type transport system involved in multi-copper enzyme maturation permease subunit